jgi:hypothetical protein
MAADLLRPVSASPASWPIRVLVVRLLCATALCSAIRQRNIRDLHRNLSNTLRQLHIAGERTSDNKRILANALRAAGERAVI